ncbi:hypothetical protein CDL12_21295 [Handroanthus impetiginosus]|uniref:Uncharacterized protein n=1 Tax=Handroanthus impetiginosus TaxID=429701 RepID=A0A2G9GLJ8_9LAMI|nr:hypothetical protein CDL12_21295 [Handroanthus impetiginosus]
MFPLSEKWLHIYAEYFLPHLVHCEALSCYTDRCQCEKDFLRLIIPLENLVIAYFLWHVVSTIGCLQHYFTEK